MLVHDFLEHSAAAHPEREALVCGGERLTYAALDARADRLRDVLRGLGLQPQERVAIHLETSIEAVVAVFAALKAGAVFVLLNPLLKPGKLAAILDDCAAAGVLTDSAEGVACAEATASVRFVLTGGALAPLWDAERPPARPGAEPGEEQDVCALIYTSGSTGTPKGVTLSHGNMVAAATSILTYLDVAATDTVLNLLPLSSDYGLYNVLMPLRRGGRVVLERPFRHPNQLVGPLNKEGVTGLPLTPTLVALLRRYRHLGIREPQKVRWITSTGQALPPAHSRWLQATFPAALIYSMYGLTECKRVSYLPPRELARRPTSVGKAIPGTEVFLVDHQGQTIDQAGQIGELIVRGPHVMQGYWNRPHESAKTLAKDPAGDGYLLRSGDLFRTDEEGYLYFVGRKDGLLKSGGYRISPREIEDVVHELEGVCEVAASAVPHDVLGHAIRLLVVLEEGAAITEEAIRRHCEERLETYMLPKEIEIRRTLPKTVAGKMDYRALAAERAP